MERLYLDFLHILKNALLGTQLSSFEELSPEQWKKLFDLAGEHKVLPLVFDTVRLLPQLQGTEILVQLRQQSRKHSSNITLDAVAAQKQGRKAKNAVLTSAFPSAAKLEGRYPYLKKHPYLLPVVWCSRLWTYSKETKNTQNNNAAEALKIGSERINLLREYGILK